MKLKHRILVEIAFCGICIAYSLLGCNDNEPPATMPEHGHKVEQEYTALEARQDSSAKGIDTGFVFIDGRYVDAPYTVTRFGGQVLVNGVLVEQHVEPPAAEGEPADDSNPQLPDSITRDTSIYDKEFVDYIRKKISYVQAHHSPEQERSIMQKVYENLPFVKEATLTKDNPGVLHIVTHSGETDDIALVIPRRKRNTKPPAIRAEEAKRNIEDRLSKGDCFFLFSSGGSIRFGREKVREILPGIVKVLRSRKSFQEKIAALHRFGLTAVDKDSFQNIITGFAASSQLEQRLEQRASEPNAPK
ncbi:MAG TPA: hypothetical protein VMW24_13895 [Sedimentisphaerales bacterium]|nr:hypothetical protein [Sedimentisphaerales bacterium]